MEPFKMSPYLKNLSGAYPNATSIRNVASQGDKTARIAIARLWMSEGIPYAFQKCPGIYESIRTWLGNHLDVNPKEINIAGSGRIGQSLAPRKIGKDFDSNSDLDLFIVSEKLFIKMKMDFDLWSSDFTTKKINPRNEKEKHCWDDHLVRIPKNIKKGFIDSTVVPSYKSYQTISSIYDRMWELKAKLDLTDDAPKIKKASIRCYTDWDSYINQMALNLLSK